MRIGGFEVKRRVWVGLGSMLLTTTAWWFWGSSKPVVTPSKAEPARPFVLLTGKSLELRDKVLRERAEYFDPTPLFFPTEKNFGQNPLKESVRRQPGQVFGSFPANLQFAGENIPTGRIEVSPAPERLADVLSLGNEAPFAGFGQTSGKLVSLAERSGFLEVRNLADGKIVVAESLVNTTLPRSDFGPLEFLIAVGSTGLIGEPVLLSGSGWDEVDNFVRGYLVKSWRLGERMKPGRYRVSVGP